jgi:hypothetical protein
LVPLSGLYSHPTYDCEIEPYLLPVYIPPWILVLDYIRQRLSFDYLHFISKTQNSSFVFPIQVFSLVIKSWFALNIVNKMTSSFGFRMGNIWKYGPYHIISKQHVAFNSFAFIHHVNHEIEMMANKDT